MKTRTTTHCLLWRWRVEWLALLWASLNFCVLPAPAQSDSALAYTFTTLAGKSGAGSADGVGDAAQFNRPRGITVDTAGNLYVADTDSHTIRKVTAAGVVSTLAGLAGSFGTNDGTGSNARFYNPQGIAVDSATNLYVADTRNHTIRKITSAGVVSTLAGLAGSSGSNDGTGSNARFGFPGGVAVDSATNVYVTDTSNKTIRKITAAGVVSTLAGLAGSSGTNDGTGSNARFGFPGGIAVDSAGNVYVADGDNHAIRKITAAGVVSTLAGLAGSSGTNDGTDNARFNRPEGIAVDSAGNLYVADSGNRTIRKITAAGVVSTLAGLARSIGSTDGTGSNARFSFPQGIAVDSAGNLYVADASNYTIRKITTAGVVSTLAGLAGSIGNADGTGSNARFSSPQGIAVDSAGNLYVADSENHTIRKITSAGVVSTLAGLAGSFGTNDGTGSNARFSSPQGIAVDSATNLYVADYGNNTIRKITSAGVVSTLAGLAGSFGTNDGTGSNARFYNPQGIAVDSATNLYVADTRNHTIRKITSAGVVSTLAGLAGSSGSTNGTGSNARFSSPQGIAVDSAGHLYVADSGNRTIRKITSAGVVSTLAGLAASSGSNDGTGSNARFSFPQGIAVDSAGHLYVPDSGNRTIRKITSAGVVSTLAGLTGISGSTDGTGRNVQFFNPQGIAVDSAGHLYVADTDNSTIRKGVFTQYGAANAVAYVQPPMNGQLTVTLPPPEANGQWRFPWEFGWHSSGATVSNLVAGNYEVEFRNVPGYLAIPIQPVQVTGGGTTAITNEYLPTLSAGDTNSAPGTLTVFLGPTPPSGAGWRFLGEVGPFFPTGFTTNLLPGTYLIEFAFVTNRVKPPSQTVQVNAGSSASLSVNYLLAATPPSGAYLPFPVPANQVNDESTYPFGFNGQLQSDTGYGSGVAVQINVVLTAAHLVFNDQMLSYVSRAHWFFRRDVGVSEPLPQGARGFYVLSGYAAQRTNDLASGNAPEQSTPPSRNMDVAALYFLRPVAGGGHGGYLPSDALPNTWLTSTALKMLVGYPVDGSQFGDASIVPGRMYQTDPQPYPLSLATDPAPGQQQVYLAPWFLSYPGNSGGPLYVQLNEYYYPVAVYLGTLFSGAQPYASVVRAIDSNVVNLITLAAAQGDSGTNNTGGGVITIIPSQEISANGPGYVRWQLQPAAAVQAGAGWRLQGDATYSSLSHYTRAVFSTNAFAVEFKPVSGWITPTNQAITVLPGQLLTYTAVYLPDPATADKTIPTVAIVSPPANARLLSSVTNLVGTAKDDKGLDRVEVQVGSGDFQPATGTSNWSAQIQLQPGTNVIRVRSIDLSENVSLTNTRTLVYVALASLSLQINGNGKATGPTNGQRLEIGKRYTLTATAKPGSVFSNWISGGMVVTNFLLKFQMTSNQQVFANFVPNPFAALKGAYNGLFLHPIEGERSHNNCGFFTLTVTDKGAFTGKLLLAGVTHPASGQFDLALHARKTIVRGTNVPLQMELQLMAGSDEITGTVSNAAWVSELSGDRATFSAASHPATNLAGNYTMALLGENDSGTSGSGFARLTVAKAGNVKLSVTLADAAAMQTVPVAAGGRVPVYLPLYAGKGSLFGWVSFIDTLTNCLEARLLWTKPSGVAGRFYPEGFTNEVTTLGSPYQAPAAGILVLDLSNAVVVLEGGNLASPLISEVTLNTLNKISVISSNTNQLTLTITLASGQLSGSFLNPDTRKLSPIKGVVLQKQNGAAGFFLGTNQSGAVFLSR